MSTPLKHSEDTFLLTPIIMYSYYTYSLAVLVQNLHGNTASYCLQCIIRLLKLDVVFQYCFGYEVWPILKPFARAYNNHKKQKYNWRVHLQNR